MARAAPNPIGVASNICGAALEVDLEEGLQFKSWLQNHDFRIFDQHVVEQSLDQLVVLIRSCSVPCIGHARQEVGQPVGGVVGEPGNIVSRVDGAAVLGEAAPRVVPVAG